MQIAVNTRLLLKDRLEGIGRFSFETLKRITTQHREHQFYFLFDREFDEEFIFSDNITPIIISPQARHPFLFYWWFELSLAPMLNRLKPDLFLSPDGYLSLGAKVRSLPVIHDINFAHHPKDVPWLVRKYYNHFFPRFARKADRIATVSEYSKKDISETYSIDPSRIDVVYNGVNKEFRVLDEKKKAEVRNRFSKGREYFLFVGSLQPRKNISRLLKSFDLFKKSTSLPTKLIIAGSRYWWTNELEEAYTSMQYREDVIFTGRITEEDLLKLTASSLAITYVPYYEGFGIPILEGMKSGVPVITSNVTSMPEVAGDAALLCDPFSEESISLAMSRISKDESLRKDLISRGLVRSGEFSWERSSGLLWESIVKTVNK